MVALQLEFNGKVKIICTDVHEWKSGKGVKYDVHMWTFGIGLMRMYMKKK